MDRSRVRPLVAVLLIIISWLVFCVHWTAAQIPFCNESLHTNTFYTVSVDYNLDEAGDNFCLIANKENVTVIGKPHARIQCSTNTSAVFAFINITNLNLSDLSFVGCGGTLNNSVTNWKESTTYFTFGNLSAVLFFKNCMNVTVIDVTIIGSSGFAIVLTDVHQKVELFNITMQGGRDWGNNSFCRGSGILLYQYNTNNAVPYENQTNAFIKLTNITASNLSCLYHSNLMPMCVTDMAKTSANPLLSAAAITLVFTQSNYNTSVNISNSIFNYTFGDIGSAVLVTFIDTEPHSTVAILDTVFTNNTVYNCSGSAIQIVLHNFETKTTKSCSLGNKRPSIEMINTLITNQSSNSAVYISMTEQASEVIIIALSNVTFTYCLNIVDRAVCFLSEALYEKADENTYLHIVLAGVTAVNNSVGYLPLKLEHSALPAPITAGIATFINIDVVEIKSLAEQPTNFSHNNASAIMAFASDFKLEGHLIFQSNKAISGTAFQLFSFCHLFLMPNLSILFENNESNLDGSVIRTEGGSYDETMCLFQIQMENLTMVKEAINFTFSNNKRSENNNNNNENTYLISAAPLYNCRQAMLQVTESDMDKVYSKIFNGLLNSSQILSKPSNVCLCHKSSRNKCLDKLSTTVVTYPGSPFRLSIIVKDPKGNSVPSGVFILQSSNNPSSWRFGSPEGSFHDYSNAPNCQDISLQLKGEPGNGIFFMSVPGMRPTFKVNVKLKDCPLGFQLLADGVCECSKFINFMKNNLSQSNLNCKLKGLNETIIYKPYHSWIGTIAHKNLAFAPQCPRQKCKNEHKCTNLTCPCVDGRSQSGLFCSECSQGMSVLLGTTECGECSNLYLLTIPAYGAGGVALVAISYYLHFTLNKGTVGSIILYANFAEIYLCYIQHYHSLQWRLEVMFVNFLNLNFGFPICLYNGMTDTIKQALQFVFPVYLWLIVLLIVGLSRWSVKLSNITSHQSPQVLITLIHLSFAKVLYSVMDIFAYGLVYIEDSNSIDGYTVEYFWYLDGTVRYWSNKHIVLMIMGAFAVLGFLLPYIVMVTFGTCLLQFRIFNKFRQFFDIVYAPYKDNMRWWFGVRQLVMVAVYISSAATQGIHYITHFIITSAALIVLVYVQAWIKPFKRACVNVLDSFYLWNIALILCIDIFFGLMKKDPPLPAIMSLFGLVHLLFLSTLVYHFCTVHGLGDKFRALIYCAYNLLYQYRHRPQSETLASLQASVEHEQYESVKGSNCELRESLLESYH